MPHISNDSCSCFAKSPSHDSTSPVAPMSLSMRHAYNRILRIPLEDVGVPKMPSLLTSLDILFGLCATAGLKSERDEYQYKSEFLRYLGGHAQHAIVCPCKELRETLTRLAIVQPPAVHVPAGWAFKLHTVLVTALLGAVSVSNSFVSVLHTIRCWCVASVVFPVLESPPSRSI